MRGPPEARGPMLKHLKHICWSSSASGDLYSLKHFFHNLNGGYNRGFPDFSKLILTRDIGAFPWRNNIIVFYHRLRCVSDFPKFLVLKDTRYFTANEKKEEDVKIPYSLITWKIVPTNSYGHHVFHNYRQSKGKNWFSFQLHALSNQKLNYEFYVTCTVDLV